MRNSKKGSVFAFFLGGIFLSALAFLIVADFFKNHTLESKRAEHLTYVRNQNTLARQRIQATQNVNFLKNQIQNNPQLRLCFSEIGNKAFDCRTFSTPQNLQLPNWPWQECFHFSGAVPCSSPKAIYRTQKSFFYECASDRCRALRIEIKTESLKNVSGITRDQQSEWIDFPASLLVGKTSFDFACPADQFYTQLDISNITSGKSFFACDGVSANNCGSSAIVVNFAQNPSQPNCFSPPSLAINASQGYKSISLFGRTETSWTISYPKGEYCSGAVSSNQVIGKAVDKTKGENYGQSGFEAGKPYPCLIEKRYHLNLPPKGKGTITNNCGLPNYDSFFIHMGGTKFFECSTSNTQISCQNKREDGPGNDMDTIIFHCRWRH